MLRLTLCLAAAAIAGGCTAGYWHRASDGLRVDAQPELLTQFQLDKTYCEGEMAKANLATGAGAIMQTTSLQAVFNGCMAGKGYIIRS